MGRVKKGLWPGICMVRAGWLSSWAKGVLYLALPSLYFKAKSANAGGLERKGAAVGGGRGCRESGTPCCTRLGLQVVSLDHEYK